MVRYVVDKIIEKIEKSSVDWQKGAVGSRSFPLKEYHERDYLKVSRSDFAKEARELELEGLLQCKWYERYSEIEEAKYHLEDRARFYEKAGRCEKYVRLEILTDYVCGCLRETKKDWIRMVFQEMLLRLESGKVSAELKAADSYLQNSSNSVDNREELEEKCGQMDIFLVLKGLDELEEAVYKRLFSSKYLKDRVVNRKTIKASKVFENCCQSAVISLAKQYHPLVDDSMDATQTLSQLYIEEYSQELALKGPLAIELDGKKIDLSCFKYGSVLNSQTLNNGVPALEQRIKTVITVENKANYEKMPYDDETLIIFCHGYFTPRERQFLKKLYINLQNNFVKYYHTGDLDYGGICIFRYIRRQIFPEVMPLYMDVKQYEWFKAEAEDLEEETLEKLKKIKEPLLQPLIDLLVKEGKGIEQENFVNIIK